ncbi:CLUMA_CG018613, isoform A [Clunio marinus]|uniref:CLUMA_CG018613, isoform A n=1 Tax=Clunio marinus TaxID=568069 RepID=A0A1J1IXD3_9DIPT|nr:CLUMA_CG018613, isoform A [Clunio marinus]
MNKFVRYATHLVKNPRKYFLIPNFGSAALPITTYFDIVECFVLLSHEQSDLKTTMSTSEATQKQKPKLKY